MQRSLTTAILTILLVVMGAAQASAHQVPTSDLLLPYFEVDLDGAGATTLLSIVNSSDDAVDVKVTLHTNWGIEVLRSNFTMTGDSVRAINLADLLLRGRLPERELDAEEIEHLQAALSGLVSPKDGLYYSSEMVLGHATGYVEISTLGNPRPDVLFGDFFVVNPLESFAQGEVLLDIDRSADCPGLCRRHGLRFLAGGGFDSGTELVIWNKREIKPSANPFFPEDKRSATDAVFIKENGHPFDQRSMGLMPLEIVKVSELGLTSPFGWLDILTEDETIMTVRYSAANRYSVGLQTFCLPILDPPPPPPPPPPGGRPSIDLEKATNGEDADTAPGPSLDAGDDVVWTYLVTNTGTVSLSNVAVEDDQEGAIDCPQDTLEPGESMTCTHNGTAELGQYANLGTVTGVAPDGSTVSDDDPSHYNGEPGPPVESAAIELEKATNGHDADNAPGPEIERGQAVTWTYEITNPSNVTLVDIVLEDDMEGAVSCPATTLAPGASMTCALSGVAGLGQYRNVATVTGRSEAGQPVDDTDPSHYTGFELPPPPPPPPANPAITIEKATNGHDADAAPGPSIEVGQSVTWTYVVTNTGDVELTQITVLDNREGTANCPQTSLQPGESMTCTLSGIAQAGQYANIGKATGYAPGTTVMDDDPSHYTGNEPPPPPPPPPAGDQGCTPGYWKNHADSWPAAGYATGWSVQSVFGAAGAYPAHGSASLIAALSFKGGSGVEGGVGNLLRAAVAALLNASHDGVSYTWTAGSVVSSVDAALASGDRDTMLSLASSLDRENNNGCPLN